MFKEKKKLDQMKLKTNPQANRKESRSSNANVSDITKVHKNVFKKNKRVSHSLQSFGEAFSNEDFGFGNGKRLNVDLDGTFTDLVFQSPSSKHSFNKESKKAGHFLRF